MAHPVITRKPAGPRRSRTAVPGTGALIKACREQAGLSQRELGERVGASQPTVGAWERGHRGIYLIDLLNVAEVLRVHVAELLPVPPPVAPVVFPGPYVCSECGKKGKPRGAQGRGR